MDSGVAEAEVDVAAGQRWGSRLVWVVAVVAALALLAVSMQRLTGSRHERSPYPAAAVAGHVTMTVVPAGQAQAALDRLAGVGRLTFAAAPAPHGTPTPQVAVGELTFRTPHNAPASGQYALFVLEPHGRPVATMWAVGPAGTNVTQGWQGSYAEVGKKYSWLRGLESTNAGMAVSFSPKTPAPITFVAQLGSPVVAASQLTVALVFIGADGHVYWAEKLS